VPHSLKLAAEQPVVPRPTAVFAAKQLGFVVQCYWINNRVRHVPIIAKLLTAFQLEIGVKA
jgi:hypothetical protein